VGQFYIAGDTAGKQGGNQFWLQLNHPGRQMPANLGQPTLAPSAVALQLGSFSRHFATPQPMSAADIKRVTEQFVQTAMLAEQAGFDGVQIHAAHGYLLSQFLSPLSNQRDDAWGGSLANRARLLLDIVRAVRAAVQPDFAVAVKLNSADFQRGGFSSDDAAQVVRWLADLQVDLVELSGGSYEAPAMQGASRDGRTLAREAYFLEFASQICQHATIPLMVTGGIRRQLVAEQVLQHGIAMVGIATALALQPALPKLWQQGQDPAPQLPTVQWRNKPLASMALMALVKYQLRRLSNAKAVKLTVAPGWALLCQQWHNLRLSRRYRATLARDGASHD